MYNKTDEIMGILQEECAEVVVAVSKVRRFGLDKSYKEGGSQRDHLTQEVGDVMLMIELLVEQGVLTVDEIDRAKQRKAEKLKIWSRIYE